MKVEATKYTEVGYVGRDVESMIRDLTENGVRLIKEKKKQEVLEEAKRNAEERLVKLLVPAMKKKKIKLEIHLKCCSIKPSKKKKTHLMSK